MLAARYYSDQPMEQIGSEQLRAIGVEVLPLIDGRQPRTTRLAALGWQGFIAANRRSEDDWCDAGELARHHQMAEEDLKQRSFQGEVYCSLLLHQARRQFAEQGLAAQFGDWGPRAYVTPVKLAQVADERREYQRKWRIQEVYAGRAAQGRAADLERVPAPLAPNLPNSADAVSALIEAVQQEALVRWGFERDRAMSAKHGLPELIPALERAFAAAGMP